MSDTATLDTLMAKLEAIEKNQQDVLLGQKILYRQMEALFALYHQFDFSAPLLGLRGWSASPDLLAVLASHILDHKPHTIFEAGGGYSTLISAHALRQNGTGHVIAVDHQDQFATLTRQHLAKHDLSAYATVIHAPLKEYRLGDETWQWYDVAKLPSDLMIDLLLVDGPPQYNQPRAMTRYPALPLLQSSMADGALILMDDADRNDETRVVGRWQTEFPLRMLRDYPSAYADSEKGLKVLQWGNTHP